MDLISILKNIEVALSSEGVKINGIGRYQNINGLALLEKLRLPVTGVKDGSHWLRTSLRSDNNGMCLTRSDVNLASSARLLIVDADSRIECTSGEVLEGAPDPQIISQALQTRNIAHVLYGSYSHYLSNKQNRYRIVIPSKSPYTKNQLPSIIDSIISIINSNLKIEFLSNVKENSTYSQPWYLPRKIASSNVENLYLHYLTGEAVDVIEPQSASTIGEVKRTSKFSSHSINDSSQPFNHLVESISVIHAFNKQYSLSMLLSHYGYKKMYEGSNFQKWISPHSTTGIPGITLWVDKFYSHHNDEFNNGKAHDSFDLFQIKEGLSRRDALIKASKITQAPCGLSVFEFNRRVWLKENRAR